MIEKLSIYRLIAAVIAMTLLTTWKVPLASQDTIAPVDDSYIYQGGPKADNIYGLLDPDTIISRKSVYSAEFTREVYVMFDMSGQAGSFAEAQVQLYGKVLEAKTVEVYYADTTWTEETLTGRNRPTAIFITSEDLEAGEDYYCWDVTNYLNSVRKSGANRVTFVWKDVAGEVSTKDTKWHSKENPSGNGPRLLLTPGEPPEIYYGNYYIDHINGNDQNSGLNPDEAWKTLANVDNLHLQPGDSLLFKSGGEWNGTFSLTGSGLPGKPVVVGKYGGETRPVINGQGLSTNTITLKSQHHLVIRDLAVTNKGSSEAFRRAIYYHAADIGEIPYVVFDNLKISDVNGLVGDESTKDNGGIFIEITGSSVPTWFDTLIISNCHVHDVNRTGISNRSSWESRTLNTNENWTPSKNVHIHHNTFERTGANALIVRVADKPLMEYNLFSHCALIGSGNASFSFNTDSAIWQYNEACFTKYNDGDNDAGGFDSDFRSKYTIIQFNYSHDNEYGGVLLTGGSGSGTGFNEGTIIRYNVFENNRHHIVRTSGNLTNSRIYNNVFYTGTGLDGVSQAWHKSWGGSYSDETYYWNNIFYNDGTNSSFDMGSSTNNLFSHNVYFGNSFQNRPFDPAMITKDPMLQNPGGEGDGFETVNNYMITGGSPAIDKGTVVEGSSGFDLAGNPVPFGNGIDIGAFEFSGTGWHNRTPAADQAGITIYPNPGRDLVWIKMESELTGPAELIIMDISLSVIDAYTPELRQGEFGYELDTGHLVHGTYFIQLRNQEINAILKFVKL